MTQENMIPLRSWKLKITHFMEWSYRYRYAVVGICVLFGFVLLIQIFYTGEKFSLLQKSRNEKIDRTLNDINSQLQEISHNPNNQVVLREIEQNIAIIKHSMMEIVKASDVQKISNQISSVKTDFDSQLTDLKNAISDGPGTKHYLESSALPFKVNSIDLIGGQPYVSVNYSDHILPLSVSDTLVGWRLVLADYSSELAEFVNQKGQYVKISIRP